MTLIKPIKSFWSYTPSISVIAVLIGLSLISGPTIMSAPPVEGRESCANPILAVAPIQPGHPLADNSIMLSGPEQTDLGAFPSDQPSLAYPTPLQNVGLLRSLGGIYSLVDLRTLMVTALDFPDARPGGVRHDSPQFMDSRGQRFTLFGDPDVLTGYLVDLQNSQVTALADLVGDPDFHSVSGMIDPTDHYLTFTDGAFSYLVDLTQDLDVSLVNSTAPTDRPMLTDDGSELLFLRKSDEEATDLVSRNLTSGQEHILTSGGDHFDYRLMPNNLLVVVNNGAISVGSPQDLPAHQFDGFATNVWPVASDHSANHLLVKDQDANEIDHWALLDLAIVAVTPLPSLAGLHIVSTAPAQNFALFHPGDDPALGEPGAAYFTLDMSSGATYGVLTQDGSDTYSSNYPSSGNGQFHLVQAVLAFQGRLWMTNGATETAQLIGQSTGNASGALSPDGCYVAISVFDTIGEGRKSQTVIQDIATGAVLQTVPNTILLGWLR